MQKLVIFIIYLNCKVYIMIVFDVKPFIHADLKNPKLSFIFFMQTINFFFFEVKCDLDEFFNEIHPKSKTIIENKSLIKR